MKQSAPNLPLSYPSTVGEKQLQLILSGRQSRTAGAVSAVEKILADVRKSGDAALFAYAKKFDGVPITAKTVRFTKAYIAAQAKKVDPVFAVAALQAAARIVAFHEKQKRSGFTIRTPEGVLSQRIEPLESVAVYIPGGYTVYPSSVLMSVIPAQIAGVKRIVAVTPPRAELDPTLAFVLDYLKVDEVYRVGGAQAIAALAYGTKSIPKVNKIVGPGNTYVALAKKMVFGAVDIDSIAGPSEVVIWADKSADPNWIALDMLSQAEHGTGDEIAVCITDSEAHGNAVCDALTAEIAASPTRKVFEKLSPYGMSVFVAKSPAVALKLVETIAPEHLQVMTKNARSDAAKVTNASAIFIGQYTPVALGDYYIGTNHILPTGGGAAFSSPLGVESFVKRISVAEVSKAGLELAAPQVSVLARAERFVHHAISVERRVR